MFKCLFRINKQTFILMKNRLVFSFTLPLSVVLLVQTAAAAPAKEVDDTLTQNSLDVAACYQNPGLATASYLE
jgi:hypothetical protein